VPEIDDATVNEVVQAHKGLDPTLVHTDPDQLPVETTLDPANPPRPVGEELKNTGNPLDAEAPPRPPAPGPTGGGGKNPSGGDDNGGGGKGPTIGGGDGTTSPATVDAATLDVPSVAVAETGTDFAGSPPGMEDAAAPGGSDYDDDLAEGGPFPDDG